MMRLPTRFAIALLGAALLPAASLDGRAANGVPVAKSAEPESKSQPSAVQTISPPAEAPPSPSPAPNTAADPAPATNGAPPADGTTVAAPVDVIVAPVKRVLPKPVVPKPVVVKAAPKPELKGTGTDAKPASAKTAGVKAKPKKLSQNDRAGKKVSRD